MSWKNFFYFSKGEKRALTLLCCLLTTSFVLLLIKEEKEIPSKHIPEPLPENKTITLQQETIVSAPNTGKTYPPKKKFTPRIRYKKSSSLYSQKYPQGTIIELNSADTTSLKKIPGIGSTFAKRIVKYRHLLGGYTSVHQLHEVYGIDKEKYNALARWFKTDTTKIRKLAVNRLPIDTLIRHPYLNYQQGRALVSLRERKGYLSGWQNLELLEEFNVKDKERLQPYLSFE
ncbi:MAG: helix-hairpin-helix domain-containing protein [Massilibacteroides sp.]|nr:helix-hairpin-helix domain-containing protein [Massilibacteroides sp.]MDD3062520.1 helix-hairpin-helix domain-containing protein [Massilibacteroides sp.]MDD4115535.1 helix-hairpin-helix domain-containing protein [Massilibacteroides sp.]MDD4660334.1 helix-hairpin-helix domain-containing protein [Massilibacteroides sp.]